MKEQLFFDLGDRKGGKEQPKEKKERKERK
jgi:hypothetical protein